MFFRLLRLTGLSLAGMILSVCTIASGAFAQSSRNDFHIPVDIEFFVIHRYSDAGMHKAFAVGPGAWGLAYEMHSAEAAASTALQRCEQGLRGYKSVTPDSECVLFDINGTRTGDASPIGENFGTVAKGADTPWQAGKEWDATTSATRGTLLLIHGCNRPRMSGWVMAWVNYYRAAGFRVILPNSFAEARDPESCDPPRDVADFNQQTRIIKRRIAQTLRTIAGIRRKYPGEPLYLHGHSEGGWIVQALGRKVSGIIITGTNCGFGHSGFYLAAKDVPILVIAGTHDKATANAGSTQALSNFCQTVTGVGQMAWVSIPGMGHYAAPWWSDVEDAVSGFLKIPNQKIHRRSSDGIAYPELTADQYQDYVKIVPHKAIAASRRGDWYRSSISDSKLDAEEEALFGCDEIAQKNPFADASRQHECALVDVNGKKLAK